MSQDAIPRWRHGVARLAQSHGGHTISGASTSPVDGGCVIAFPRKPGNPLRNRYVRRQDVTGSNVVHFGQPRSRASANGTHLEANIGKREAFIADDDRRRTLENAFAAAVSIVLIFTGSWIFSTLAKMP